MRASVQTLLAAALCAAPALADAPRLLGVDDSFALQDVADPQLSPDGKWVAYTVSWPDAQADAVDTDVYMVPIAGGAAVRLTTSAKPETAPRFSPDGRWLAFLSGREGKQTQVWLLNRAGGEAVKLTRFKAGVSDLAWSPDSTRLALVARDPDPDDPEAEADDDDAVAEAPAKPKPPRPIVIRRRQFKRDTEGYLGEFRDHLHVFDLASKSSQQITTGAYDDREPAWAPDGRSLAFVSNRTADPDSNQNTDVFVVEARAGALPRALTTSPGHDRAPAFSPDGKQVAYIAGGDPKDMWYGSTAVAVVPFGGGPAQPLTQTLDRNVEQPEFAADGRNILFRLEDGGNQHLARVAVAGGPVTRVVAGERDVQGYAAGPHGEIVVLETSAQQPAELSLVTPGGLSRLTHVNDTFLKQVRTAPVERFKARSADGTLVDGYLTRPPGAAPGARLPTILRIHGGPTMQFSTEWSFEWQLLAASGYAVVAANPRGSTGHGTAFSRAIWADWGHKDFEDVMAAVDHVIAMGVADPQRLGVGGWSYGGILTNLVITQTARFKAATSGASEVNYTANYGTDHYQYEWETELGLPWRESERWLRMSPFFRVEKITTPTLVLGGADDVNVPLLNSEQLYQALRRLGRETELVIYPGQNHEISRPSFVKDRHQRYLDWYGRFLKPAP